MQCFKGRKVTFQVPDEAKYGRIRGMKKQGTVIDVRGENLIIQIDSEWRLMVKEGWIVGNLLSN